MNSQAGPSFISAFSKSQASALLATLADWGVLFTLVEGLHVWYVAAVAVGSVLGALVNFLLNRHWSFEASGDRWHGQAARYTAVSAASAGINSAGCYALTDLLKFHYAASVLVVSVLVGLFFNFPLHRYYVFRRES